MSSLICFALKEAAAPFQKITAATAQAGLSIRLTGIGRPNAEKSLRELTKLICPIKFEPL